MTNQEVALAGWHEEGVEVASRYKRCEARLVELLSQIARIDGFYRYKCESLRSYAIFVWGLPENAASDLVTVAKKAVAIPEMIDALKAGEATVAKLRKICPVIDRENHRQWLDLVGECSTRAVERAVAMAKPEETSKEALVYKTGDRLEMKLGVSEELLNELRLVQDLLAQKMQRTVTVEETLAEMAKLYRETNDPVLRANRALARKANRSDPTRADRTEPERTDRTRPEQTNHAGAVEASPSPQSAETPGRATPRASRAIRKCLPSLTLHRVRARDGHRCTHTNEDGQRCARRRWLDIHHKIEISRGGSDEVENLTTLCRAHHRMTHSYSRDPGISDFTHGGWSANGRRTDDQLAKVGKPDA